MTLVYGWGNPIYGDDAVGIQVAKEFNRKVPSGEMKVEWSSKSPFSVVESFLGHEKVFLIDAINVKGKEEGEIVELEINGENVKEDLLTPHSASLLSVIALFKQLHPDLFPKDIRVFGVCLNSFELTEGLSKETQENSDKLVRLILDRIKSKEN